MKKNQELGIKNKQTCEQHLRNASKRLLESFGQHKICHHLLSIFFACVGNRKIRLRQEIQGQGTSWNNPGIK